MAASAVSVQSESSQTREPRLIGPIARCVLAAFASLAAGCALAEPAHVRIGDGDLTGASDGVVRSFKGVPYAAPPVGPLRWRPPQPAKPWSGELDANAFGASCAQARPPPRVLPGDPAARTSEDCLTVNVWAPAQPGPARPVMVWLHGGGNDGGTTADPYYDGYAFARDGVVMVSLNYRLGALGFFAHPALTREAGATAPLADYGLMDQIAALKWVQRNIAAFGGDPGNVTLFGESAGGEDVVLLMSAPSARGLFAKAIVESGAEWNLLPDLGKAEREGAAVAFKAGLAGPLATAAQLRALPASALTGFGGDEDSGPAVDGRLLPQPPLEALRAGKMAAVPLIIGTNGDEASLLAGARLDLSHLFALTPDELKTLRGIYGAATPDDATLARAIWRDALFAAPARMLAARRTAQAPVWLYRFSYVLSRLRLIRSGANHGSEIPYVFSSWRIPLLTDQDQRMIVAMHGCWVAFAKTGKPDCPGAPAWPAYSPRTDQQMEFGEKIGPRQVPDRQALDLLTARLPSLEGRR
jgi:para-nitrobenzyl esterase